MPFQGKKGEFSTPSVSSAIPYLLIRSHSNPNKHIHHRKKCHLSEHSPQACISPQMFPSPIKPGASYWTPAERVWRRDAMMASWKMPSGFSGSPQGKGTVSRSPGLSQKSWAKCLPGPGACLFPSLGLNSFPVKSEVRLDQGWQVCETFLPSFAHADVSNYTRLYSLSPDSVSEAFSIHHFRWLALKTKFVAAPGLEESPGSLPGYTLELQECQ